MELEHSIGFSGEVRGSLHLHPDGHTIVYALGGGIVIAGLEDAHEQSFLHGHDDCVTCLALSQSGRYIVSGQRGDNADVIVWDFESRSELYRFQEHDHGVILVELTSDERFLLTVGADKKMVVWDMHTGMIVVTQSGLKHTACACWGGRRRDKKGRMTTDYQLVTGGESNLTYWTLDAMAGKLEQEECTLGNQVRNFTALAFSHDEEYVFAGSSSSDFTAVHVKHKVLHSTTVCGSGGVRNLVAMASEAGDRVLVGCGDGLVAVFEGMRNGAQTCRTYSKGPAAACAQKLDGAVSAMSMVSMGSETNPVLKLLIGTELGTVYDVSLAYADDRALGAPPARSIVVKQSHSDKVVAVSYPRNNPNFFATASADGTLRVWDVNTYEVISKAACQPAITGPPQCIDFTGEVIIKGAQPFYPSPPTTATHHPHPPPPPTKTTCHRSPVAVHPITLTRSCSPTTLTHHAHPPPPPATVHPSPPPLTTTTHHHHHHPHRHAGHLQRVERRQDPRPQCRGWRGVVGRRQLPPWGLRLYPVQQQPQVPRLRRRGGRGEGLGDSHTGDDRPPQAAHRRGHFCMPLRRRLACAHAPRQLGPRPHAHPQP